MEDGLSASVAKFTEEAFNILYRLNTRRLIASGGPRMLPRDWRGLASLADISPQDVKNHPNMVQWTLDTWVRNGGSSATVRQLIVHLELIDRHDIKDDLMVLAAADRLVNGGETDETGHRPLSRRTDKKYDALVLYSEANQGLIDEMIEKMTQKGINLLAKPYRLNTELTHSRCRHTVLVYSTDFFQNLDYKFFIDYNEHTRNTEMTQYRLIPCIYEQCQVPKPLQFHFPLYVNTVAYDFWDQLAKSINTQHWHRLPDPSASSPPTARPVPSSTNQCPNDADMERRSLIRSIARWYRRRTRLVLNRIHPRPRPPSIVELQIIAPTVSS